MSQINAICVQCAKCQRTEGHEGIGPVADFLLRLTAAGWVKRGRVWVCPKCAQTTRGA